jgi:hypothetical protein
MRTIAGLMMADDRHEAPDYYRAKVSETSKQYKRLDIAAHGAPPTLLQTR